MINEKEENNITTSGNPLFFCIKHGRCGCCGGELGYAESFENDIHHIDRMTCIEVLQNTLKSHIKNTEILENTIEKLILTLDKIIESPYNEGTKGLINIAKDALDNL